MLGAGFMKINNNFIDLFGNKIRNTLQQQMIHSGKSNYDYNKKLISMAFDQYLKDLKQSIADLNTRFDTKIDENRMKNGIFQRTFLF